VGNALKLPVTRWVSHLWQANPKQVEGKQPNSREDIGKKCRDEHPGRGVKVSPNPCK